MARDHGGLGEALAARLAAEIAEGALPPGARLPAQGLADRFGVSRSPVARALALLESRGLARRDARRGFSVAPLDGPAPPLPAPPDPVTAAYRRLAEDRLAGRLPDAVSGESLRDRYGLSAAALRALLARVLREGWMERRPGYLYRFTAMLGSADALLQSYRARLAIEPAALLEAGYSLPPATALALRRTEEALLSGAIATLPSEALHDRGVRFHEALVAASGNPFLLDALRRINEVRRLLSYRAALSRERLWGQARDHVALLDLLGEGRRDEAAQLMRDHLGRVMGNLERIRPLLEPPPR